MFPAISSAILGTVIFLFFLLPGFAFLRTVWGSEKGSLQKENLYIYLVWGTPVSVIIYTGLFFPINVLIEIPFKELFEALASKQSPELSHVGIIIVFALFVSLVSAILGFFVQRGITYFWLDANPKLKNVLKFNSDWFYILSGRREFFVERKTPATRIIMVDILSIVDDVPYIYSGVMYKYNLKKDGTLEYIQLIGTSRRPLEQYQTSTPSKPAIHQTPSLKVTGDLTVNGAVETNGLIEVSGNFKANTVKINGGVIHSGSFNATSLNIDGTTINTSANATSSPTNQTYSIPGDTLVITGEEIKNINCSYWTVPLSEQV